MQPIFWIEEGYVPSLFGYGLHAKGNPMLTNPLPEAMSLGNKRGIVKYIASASFMVAKAIESHEWHQSCWAYPPFTIQKIRKQKRTEAEY